MPSPTAATNEPAEHSHSEHQSVTSRRLAIAGTYFVQGMLFLTLTTRLPRISKAWHLGEGQMSLFMLMMVLLAGVGSVAAEQVAVRRGSATSLRCGLALLAVGFVILGLHASLVVFGVGLAVYGLALGIVDASSNMQAVALEHEVGRPILPSFHGAWTLGGVVATLFTLATAHLSFIWALSALAIVPLALVVAPLMHSGDTVPAPEDEKGIPWRRIILVGLALVVFYMVDTASTTWGTTYLHKVVDAPERLAPLATLPYLLTTGIARFAGDRLAASVGPVKLLRVGAVLAFVSLAIIVGAPIWPVAVIGFALLGIGVAVIAPLSFSAAASIAREGLDHDPAAVRRRVDAVIARFNQFNYAGALLGSVLTGALGAINLRIGFAVPLVLVLALLPLAGQFHS